MRKKHLLPLLAVLAVLLAAAWQLGAPSQGNLSSAAEEPATAAPVVDSTQPVEETAVPSPQEAPPANAAAEEVPLLPSIPETSAPAADTFGDLQESAAELHCTVSISCAVLLDNPDRLSPETAALVPADGWVLPPETVSFIQGDSAFDVLLRLCRQAEIHLEFEDTPLYGSAYIEGIQNLYEFDCGDRSGWMYQVNGVFPNYGCSQYTLSDGDTVSWVYTCDLGADVDGGV